jgi:hypothetical protein
MLDGDCFRPSADWMIAFIDDTGHETFAGNHQHYGLGGCAVMGAALPVLQARWRGVRALVHGSPDVPLHAASMPRLAKNFVALADFFRDRTFVRFAVTSTNTIKCPPDIHTAKPLIEVLKKQIVHIASHSPFRSLAVVFESSQRADPLIEELFGSLELQENGTPIPVSHYFLPKAAGEPGLEVADFIINSAASETRKRMKGVAGMAKDFADVFTQVPPAYRRFMMIETVSSTEVSVA